jgi:DNA polymerase-1
VTSIRKFDIKRKPSQERILGYKANRKAMPEDLAQQVPYIRRALEAYRIPILEVASKRRRDRHSGPQSAEA